MANFTRIFIARKMHTYVRAKIYGKWYDVSHFINRKAFWINGGDKMHMVADVELWEMADF